MDNGSESEIDELSSNSSSVRYILLRGNTLENAYILKESISLNFHSDSVGWIGG